MTDTQKSQYASVDGVHIDPSTYRPSDTRAGGVTGQVTIGKGRVPYTYPDPVASAKGYISNKSGQDMSDLIAELYSAGYISRDQAKFFPMGEKDGNAFFYPELSNQTYQYLLTAMTNALKDANVTGTGDYKNIVNTRRNEIAAGIRGRFYGETALESTTIDSKDKSGSSPTVTYYIYTRNKSDESLDKWYKENLGRVATDKEKSEFYKVLVKKQTDPRNASTYQTVNVGGRNVVSQTTGGVSVEQEVEDFAIGKINFLDKKTLGTGVVNDTVTSIRSAANQYGIALTGKKLVEYSKSLLDGTMTDDSLKEQFANTAKAHYTAYADKIDKTTSVQDIAKTFINRKAQILEMSPDSFKIKDVESALTGDKPMSYTDFDKMVRRDPRYQETSSAKNSALAFAQTIAQAFGYGV